MKKMLMAAMLLSLVLVSGCKKNEVSNLEPIITDMVQLSADGIDKLKQEHKGKIIVINFFASWCPPCKIEMPDFVKAYENNKDKKFIIIGISIEDSKKDAINFVNQYRVTFPVYLADKALQAKYNISKIPTTLIYDQQGGLASIAEGMLNEAYLNKLAANAQ